MSTSYGATHGVVHDQGHLRAQSTLIPYLTAGAAPIDCCSHCRARARLSHRRPYQQVLPFHTHLLH